MAASFLMLCPAGLAQVADYSNPVFDCGRDPDVELLNGEYYMTVPGPNYYYSYKSPDLVNWSAARAIGPTVPSGQTVWKGMIAKASNTSFYFYYTDVVGSDTTTTKVANSAAPDSADWNTNFSFAIANCIDPYLFKDTDGKLYFYYKQEVTGLRIWVQPMSSYTTASGSPTLIISPNGSGWEACGEPQLEGTAVFKSGSIYYVLYTGGYDDTASCYGIGAAWSTSPTGPFTKCSNNPFISYRNNANILSAGAPRIVPDGGGGFWITYRTWWPTPGTGDKSLSIDKIAADNVNHVLNVTPTWDTAEIGPVPPNHMDDFDGDGVPDAVTVNTNTYVWSIRFSRDGSVHPYQFGTNGDIPMIAQDLNRDGLADYVIYRPSNYTFYYTYNGGGTASFVWTNGTPLMSPISFDGNGVANAITVSTNASNALIWNIRWSHDGSNHSYAWGVAGDIPFASEDLNRDGLADYVVYRPSNHSFYYLYNGGGSASFQWTNGLPLMSGISYDQNGVANAITITTNASNALVWNVRFSHDSSNHPYQFGTNGDIPCAKWDLNQDGITDYAVYRPSNHTYYWLYGGGGGSGSFVLGTNGDIPVF
ncbi:MAG TPA: family 43 glycosylhydrolase [Verrucomicrobiae bacterium]|jgi:hypothetical protein|nr:family 43 glycosylhydrolase [Verrucomicrobiae bacterium]